MRADLLIRDGILVDGSNKPRQRCDLAISNGRVVKIDKCITDPAKRTLNVAGSVIAPGFIDVHTHYDAAVLWDPSLTPSSLHGVTTVVSGNCGFSIAPIAPHSVEYIMRMLARVEGMPLAALESTLPWNWTSTEEYFHQIDGSLAINVGFMVGHSAIRRMVMGESSVLRSATEEEIRAMSSLLHDGLAAGGLGFSSSWSETHNDWEGNPVPSRLATSDELLTLSGVCRGFPGTSLEFLPANEGQFNQSLIELACDMSRAARRPLNWNPIIVTKDNINSCYEKLAAGTYAERHGGRVIALSIPYQPAPRLSFLSGFLLDALPGWRETMFLTLDEKMRALQDPIVRRKLEARAANATTMEWLTNWSTHVITEVFSPELREHEGRQVGDIANECSQSPFDALLDLACADSLRTTFTRAPLIETRADWEARARFWRDDRVVVGASDAGAHLDMVGTFNYATELIANAVREWGVMSLEEAIYMLTKAPAQLYGLHDRGQISEGSFADLVIFNPDTIASMPLRTRFDMPGNAGRLYAGASGIEHVFVNGVEVVRGQEFTGDLPGKLLRSGADTATPSLK